MTTISAIPINAQYVYSSSLQQAFIDIRSGEPLSSGTLTFYRDIDRITLKPIYAVSGTDDNPVFTALPNPLSLSSIGTIIDPNNNAEIVPVWKPYDDDGNPDPYYIVIEASDGYPQGTRTNFPFVNNQGDNISVQIENYIPDGQFLFHNDLPNNGLINQDITPIAFGGWRFFRTTGTTSVNYVTFERFDAPIDDPEANPRYALRYRCTTADSADTRKDISWTTANCNLLQNKNVTEQICAYSNDGDNHDIQLIIRKYFGLSPSSGIIEEVISTFTVTPTITNFPISFTVSNNEGKTLSSTDTDRFELVWRMPLSSISDISFVNAIFVEGTFSSLNFPNLSDQEQTAFSLPASFSIPDYSGADNGKYIQVGTTTNDTEYYYGFSYGNPFPTGTISLTFSTLSDPDNGFVWCDGTAYPINDPLYSPLFQKIGYNSGTGINGFRNSSSSTNICIQTYNRNDFTQPGANAGTSGFSFSNTTIGGYIAVQITTIAASSMTPGSYYTIVVNLGTSTFTQLFWFTIDNIGTIPSIAHDVYSKIDLLSTDTDTIVRNKLVSFANGLYQVPNAPGSFFRAANGASGIDPDANSRTANGAAGSGASGNNVGSFQSTAVIDHQHNLNDGSGHNALIGSGSTIYFAQSSGTYNLGSLPQSSGIYTGSGINVSTESRPPNLYVRVQIKL